MQVLPEELDLGHWLGLKADCTCTKICFTLHTKTCFRGEITQHLKIKSGIFFINSYWSNPVIQSFVAKSPIHTKYANRLYACWVCAGVWMSELRQGANRCAAASAFMFIYAEMMIAHEPYACLCWDRRNIGNGQESYSIVIRYGDLGVSQTFPKKVSLLFANAVHFQ